MLPKRFFLCLGCLSAVCLPAPAQQGPPLPPSAPFVTQAPRPLRITALRVPETPVYANPEDRETKIGVLKKENLPLDVLKVMSTGFFLKVKVGEKEGWIDSMDVIFFREERLHNVKIVRLFTPESIPTYRDAQGKDQVGMLRPEDLPLDAFVLEGDFLKVIIEGQEVWVDGNLTGIGSRDADCYSRMISPRLAAAVTSYAATPRRKPCTPPSKQ
jgi:hypothetical protein